MAGILIVAHTPLASALLEFVEHVFGQVPDDVFALNVPPHEAAKITFKKLNGLIEQMKSNQEILVLTDIMGATPSNVASRLASQPGNLLNIQIITGVNLPMLLRAVSHRHEPLQEIVEKSLQGGQQGVIRIRETGKVSL
jgi:PTS system ascorbate-specific IIA component